MAWLKTDLEIEVSSDAFTQVDLNGKTTGTPTEIILQVANDGSEVQFRVDNAGAVYSSKEAPSGSGMNSIRQVRIPIKTNRYFEYKTFSSNPITAHLIFHN